MIIDLVVVGVIVAAAIAVGVAFYKHHTAAAVVTSAKKEVADIKTSAKAEFQVIDAEISKLGTAASTDLKAAYTRLKSLF